MVEGGALRRSTGAAAGVARGDPARPAPASQPAIGGVDEAGRGPLAGPVVAAVVVLSPGQRIAGVRDSKRLTPARREELAEQIRHEALEWAIGRCSAVEIDALNILQASLLAMQRAIAALSCAPAQLLIDGNRAPELADYPGRIATVVGGDRLVLAISAASILAKVARDRQMLELDEQFPGYGFARHRLGPTGMR
jgi:ribonuclease HII